MIPKPLETLIKNLSRLPGLGPRSAQKAALHLLMKQGTMPDLQRALLEVANTVQTCHVCGNIGLATPCHICTDQTRNHSQICVVEGVDDLWAMERSGSYKGQYHVLGGVVNALDGVGPDDVNIPKLIQRVTESEGAVTELVLALSASVDGQTTGHLIARRLAATGVAINTLARGIPVGASVDYMDDGTLSLAFEGRRKFG
ncbi:MAG: recombination mediator RecR [Alphaproteobacteria bacterium]